MVKYKFQSMVYVPLRMKRSCIICKTQFIIENRKREDRFNTLKILLNKQLKKNVKNLVMLHYPTNGFLTDKTVEITEEIGSLDFNNLVTNF